MPERRELVSKIRDKIPTRKSLMALGAASAVTFGFGVSQSSVESPKRDDGDVAASRFVMTPPGAKKWPESNAFAEAISQEIQKNLFKIGEEFKIEWYEREIPVAVVIPSLGIESALVRTQRIPHPEKEGVETFETPDLEIAVPNELLRSGEHTNVFIYQHSRWAGVARPFRNIASLDVGDRASIVSGSGEVASFEVREFKIVDYEDPTEAINQPHHDVVTFQTTAMDDYNWLIDETELAGKAEVPLSASGHLALQVVLEPVEE